MTLIEVPTRSGRILALDGWRGIAILLVLFDHIQVALVGRYRWSWTETGQHGVAIFFVLSGFLITSKLLETPINLRNFYIRRFFRLMPAAWAYLAVISLLTLATGVRFTSIHEVISCLLFYRNFAGFSHASLAGHFWTLSLEEQFYLSWPLILMLAGSRRSCWIAGGGAALCALYRYIFWARYDHLGPSFQTQVHADALLIGCLTAPVLTKTCQIPRIQKLSALFIIPAFATLVYCIANFRLLTPLIESIAIAILIAFTVLHPVSIISRSLSLRPLAWLGVVSYSVYLWQDLFIHILLRNPVLQGISLFVVMPAFALASYYWIERPCTRIGHRLTKRPTPQTLSATSDEHGATAPAAASAVQVSSPYTENP